MENPAVTNLRSRSRSKTPFLRSSCDRENCVDDGDHVHSKSGRMTPVKSRDTPTKLVPIEVETIQEDLEPVIYTSPPAHRTRNATKQKATIVDAPVITSDYSSEETESSPYLSKEVEQNIRNYSYEYARITTSTTSNGGGYTGGYSSGYTGGYSGSYSGGRHSRLQTSPGSPDGSDHSNESFAESILADSSRVSVDGTEHLPYKLYKHAVEYWNKYPKTDYTYSRLSKDRVELAPGQVAVPNMSRPSLGRHGHSDYEDSPSTVGFSELCRRWESTALSTRAAQLNNMQRCDSYSDLEYDEVDTQAYSRKLKISAAKQHWWITTLLISMWTSVVTTTTTIKRRILGQTDANRYPYSGRTSMGSYSQTSSFFSTVTKTAKKWWLIIPLLLLIPLLFLYANPEYKKKLQSIEFSPLPDFSDLGLHLPELTLPELCLPDFKFPNIPEFSLPNVSLPEMPETYYKYKAVASDRLNDFTQYLKILGQAYFDETVKLWNGIIS